MSFCDFEEVQWDADGTADNLVKDLFLCNSDHQQQRSRAGKEWKTKNKKKTKHKAETPRNLKHQRLSEDTVSKTQKRKMKEIPESDSVVKKQKLSYSSPDAISSEKNKLEKETISKNVQSQVTLRATTKGRKKSKNKFKQDLPSSPAAGSCGTKDLDLSKVIKSSSPHIVPDGNQGNQANNKSHVLKKSAPSVGTAKSLRSASCKTKKVSKVESSNVQKVKQHKIGRDVNPNDNEKTPSKKTSVKLTEKKVKKIQIKGSVDSVQNEFLNSDLKSSHITKTQRTRGNKIIKPSKFKSKEENQATDVSLPSKPKNKKLPFRVDKLKDILAKSGTSHTFSVNQDRVNIVNKARPLSLKDRLQEQLRAARFRYINEQLYTRQGSEAYHLFREDEEAFQVYHEGFQGQVTKWPENPIDKMIDYISNKPRSSVVADFGCGDAKLALSIPNKVHSFDLVALNPRVTACDMANVPLESDSVDIGVFCLSLMGTNLVDYITEAHRVIKKRGTLLVAEVVSRFENIRSFVRVMERFGFILLEKDTNNKMFVWFNFKKAGRIDKGFPISLALQPCIYKKR